MAERVKKIDRKRAEREIRAESDKATRMENKVDKLARQADVVEQREIAQVSQSLGFALAVVLTLVRSSCSHSRPTLLN